MSPVGVRRAVCALLACLLAGLLAGPVAPAAAHDVRVRHTLFGVHDGSGQSMALVHEGSVRLWDVGVRWLQIEKTPGLYDWTRLDALVTAAQAAHVEVTYVAAMTPSFYAPLPSLPPDRLSHYRDFLTALMERYRSFHGERGIAAYQVWNEANISNFWTGTPHQMAQLTRTMDEVRDAVDPDAQVVSAPLTSRLPYQVKWLQRFEAQRLHGIPVWHYFDVAALNLYPLPSYDGRPGTPEDAIAQLRSIREVMSKAGVPRSLPIWNTEVNYGLQTGVLAGHPADPIPESRQAAYVIRTYLLNAANGVDRVFWYRFDMNTLPLSAGGGTLGNTMLSEPADHSRLTRAGRAYLLVQEWMQGRLKGSKGHGPCRTDRHGTYTCVVRGSSMTRRIYWNPLHHAHVRLAKHARHLQDELGVVSGVKGGSSLRVGSEPVMVSR
ncbi:MAG: hypothetical protein WB797_06700, partial [Nocardioides sp.]